MDSLRGFVAPGPAAALAVVVAALVFLVRSWRPGRKHMRKMQKLGKPMPRWDPVFGSLLAAGKAFASLPPGAHNGYMMHQFAKDFPGGAFYLDTWPMADCMLVVFDPDMANQVVYHPRTGSRKPPMLQDWFKPITGGPSLFDTNGSEWRYLHDVFMPAFSNSKITGMVPLLIDRIAVFRELLREKATTGELFALEPYILRLITDTIGRFLLSIELDAQRQSHPLSDAMWRQLEFKFVSQKPQNLIALLNPWVHYRTWKNGRVLDGLIQAHLQERFTALRSEMVGGKDPKGDTVLDLVLLAYLTQPGRQDATAIDPDFLDMATRNMRMFFFAGYDSTAGATAYCYYNIFRYPEVLRTMRAEHDAVLGPDIDAAPRLIAENPALLNALPYTVAVIKETMRIFPMAGGIRDGCADLELVDAAGNRYPTEGFGIVVQHYCTQRNPRYWPRADEFLPERWLVGPDHELHPPKGGWRAFEFGPRLCIGQQLVMTEIKAILASTVRELDIRACYDEAGPAARPDLGLVGGEPAYMTETGAAHPAEQLPCRLSLSGYVPGSAKA